MKTGLLLASALLLAACDDGGAKTTPSAGTTGASTPKTAPTVDPKAKELAVFKSGLSQTVRTGYGLFLKAKDEKWPAKCPALDKAEVLLVTTYAAQSVMSGTKPKPMKQDYFEQVMAPPSLTNFPRSLRDVEAARRLSETTHIAFVQITEHEAGKRVDEKTFKPGTLGGWVSVVDVKQKKGLCRFSLKAKNSDSLMGVTMTKVKGLEGLNNQGFSSDLAKSFARTLAARLEKDSQATLVDDAGPVASSKRYAAEKPKPK